MISWRGYFFCGLFFYLWFVLSNLPVAWLYTRFIPDNLPIQLTGLKGAPWSGQVEKTVLGPIEWIKPISLGPLQWQLRWFDLLSGRLSVALTLEPLDDTLPSNEGQLSGHVVVGADLLETTLGLFLEQGAMSVSLTWLTHLIPFSLPENSGHIRLNLESMLLQDSQQPIQQLSAKGELLDIRLGSPLNLNLGNFILQAHHLEDGGIKMVIHDREAHLKTKINFRLDSKGYYTIRGTLMARKHDNKQLISMLRTLGKPGPGGRVAVNLSGNLFTMMAK